MAKKDVEQPEPENAPAEKPAASGIVAPPGASITMKQGGAHNQIKLPDEPKMAKKTPLQRPTRPTETQAP